LLSLLIVLSRLHLELLGLLIGLSGLHLELCGVNGGLQFLLGGLSTVKFKDLGSKYVKILEVILIYRRRSIKFL